MITVEAGRWCRPVSGAEYEQGRRSARVYLEPGQQGVQASAQGRCSAGSLSPMAAQGGPVGASVRSPTLPRWSDSIRRGARWSRRPGPHLVQARGATALPPGADLYPSVARTATSMPVWMGGVTKAVAVYVVNWGQEAFTTPTRLVPAPATTSSALPTWRERLLYIGTPRQSAPSHRRVPGRFPPGALSIRGGRR